MDSIQEYPRLSLDEADFVRRFAAEKGEQVRFRVSLEYWLREWATFVVEVEAGYPHSIYEYADDLSVRDILQRLMEAGPPSLATKVAAWLHPWDQRFEGATEPSPRPVAPGIAAGGPAWWFRIPKRRGEELEADLASEGLV